MAKKIARSRIVKYLDIAFSRYIRLKNADKTGYCTCVTCNREYHYKNIQAGHFMSRKNYSTRWDERNVYPQCYGCNVMQQGKQYEFSLFLGKQVSEELLYLSKKIVKFSDIELTEMKKYYENLVQVLEKSYV